MRNYEVFADYCSTGIWDSSDDSCVDIPDYVSLELRMLIKYWHDYWECAIDDDFEFLPYFNPQKFLNDGKIIVELLNNYGVDNFTLRLDEYEN